MYCAPVSFRASVEGTGITHLPPNIGSEVIFSSPFHTEAMVIHTQNGSVFTIHPLDCDSRQKYGHRYPSNTTRVEL